MAHLPGRRRNTLSAVAAGLFILSGPGVSFGQITSYAFVPNPGGALTATVFETVTNTALGNVTIGSWPQAVAAAPDGRRVYVLSQTGEMVQSIDVVTRTGAGVFFLWSPGLPTAMAIAPDGRALYVAQTSFVTPIDLTTNTMGAAFAGPGPIMRGIAITPDGLTAYVTSDAGTLPMDLATGTFGAAIPTGAGSEGIAITPDGQTAYVTDSGANSVIVVDLATQSVIGAPIAVGANPYDVAMTPDGAFAYVANVNSNTVSVINVATHAVAAAVPVGAGPYNAAFTPDGRYAYALNNLAGTATQIDVQTHTPVGSPIPAGPTAFAKGGGFITPNIIVQPGGPFSIANDAELTTAGFRSFVPFHQGTLRLTGDWTTSRHLSLLAGGGTIDTNGFNATVTGDLINNGQLTKTGAGILKLEGQNGHAGTVVNAGTLVVTGAHPSPLTINAGTLRGSGGVGDVTIGNGATWAPGEGEGAVGLVQAGDVMMSAGATLEIQLSGTTAGTGYDAIANSGAAAINGAQLVLTPMFAPPVHARFVILSNATGTFDNLPEGALFFAGGYAFRITYLGGDGNDVELFYDEAPALQWLAPLTLDEDAGHQAIPFYVTDDYNFNWNELTASAVSMNPALLADVTISRVPNASLHYLELTPRPNAHGTAEIQLTTSDGTLSKTVSVTLTVNPVNDVPTIAPVAPQTIPANAPLAPITLTIGDVDDDVSSLTVTATSFNQAILPDANVVLGGSGATRTLTLTPAANVHGPAGIRLTVSDGEASSFTLFVLTVAAPYYLAEGATGPFFDTDILIVNPNDIATSIVATFLKDDGTSIVQNRALAPLSRTTIRADEVAGLEHTTFSTTVSSMDLLPLVVERTMRWDASGYGAHTEKAAAGAAWEWTFAEGAEGGFFHTYLLLTNPHHTANTAQVWYLREGEPSLFREYPLAPASRTTIQTALEPELRDRSFGAIVAFLQPGVAERAMYFGDRPAWLGGSGALGSPAPYPNTWFLAEGATGDYFTTFLLIVNPWFTPADVTVTYMPDTGAPVTKTYTVQPEQRLTRNIALEDPSLAHAAVATKVESTEPIVVERAMYWGRPAWIDAHVSAGVAAAATRWGLAEGRVGGADDAQTYILLANPGAEPTDVTITFLRENGGTVAKTFTLPPTSRFNVAVVAGSGSMAPELVNESFGARIDSILPIVVERSLYTNVNGVTWAAGTNAAATRLP